MLSVLFTSLLKVYKIICPIFEYLYYFKSALEEQDSLEKKKGRDLTQFCDKTPIPTKRQQNKVTIQKRHHNLQLYNDCGSTRDGQLSCYCHLTGVIQPGNWMQPDHYPLKQKDI